MTGRIQIFAKAPLPGVAKSRLIPALGSEGAARLQAHFIHHTLATTAQLPLSTELWCAPAKNHPAFMAAAHTFSVYLYQQEGDGLGERMNHALTEGLSRGGPVVLIGTDCPTLAADDLHEAFDALAKQDAVLGPSADGGYYLIGLNSPQPQLFNDMPWSTSRVLNETRTRLDSAGLHWHELRTLHDIDTPADLIHLPHPLKQVVSL
jgi:rSAM/selenodomain-associated transferase 1